MIGAGRRASRTTFPYDERTITDADFFQALDLSWPGLQKVAQAWRSRDLETARRETVHYFRRRRKPKWHVDLRDASPAEYQAHCFARADTETLLSKADDLLRNVFRLSNLSLDLGPDLDWHIAGLQELNALGGFFKRMPYLQTLADAYMISGNAKYIEKYCEILGRYLEEWPLVWELRYPSAYVVQEKPVQEAMSCGFRVLTWMHLLYTPVPYDARVPVALTFRMIRSLWFTAWQYRRFDEDGFRSNNHHLWERGLLPWQFALMLPEFPEFRSMFTRGQEVVDQHIWHDFFAEGGYKEHSMSYAGATLGMFILTPAHLGKVNRKPLLSRKAGNRVRKSMEALFSMIMPNNHFPRIGDDTFALDITEQRENVQMSLAQAIEYGAIHSGPCQAILQSLEITAGKPKRVRLPPLSVCWERAGYVAGRDGWRRNSNYFIMSTNTIGEMGHDHLDMLSMILHVGGETIIDDPATDLYHLANTKEYKGSELRGYLTNMSAHNTILAYGEPIQADIFYGHGWVFDIPKTEILHYAAGRSWLQAVAMHRGYPSSRCRREVLFAHRKGWVLRDTVSGGPVLKERPHVACTGASRAGLGHLQPWPWLGWRELGALRRPHLVGQELLRVLRWRRGRPFPRKRPRPVLALLLEHRV